MNAVATPPLDSPSSKFDIPWNAIRAPWFVDPGLSMVTSGHRYGHRCVAAIGPADCSRVMFVSTSNPRQAARRVEIASGMDLVVHEAIWSQAQTASKVLPEVLALIDQAGIDRSNGWMTVPPSLLRELLLRAADNAGVTVLTHAAFTHHVLEFETEKLRARLKRGGVPANIADAHRYVSVPFDPVSEAQPVISPRQAASTSNKRNHRRNMQIGSMFKRGATQQQIGDAMGISRQRVQRILADELSLGRADGGAAVRGK